MTGGGTRRWVLAGAAALGPAIIVRPSRAAEYKFAQYHNQAASGTLHKNLNAMWQTIAAETNGRVEATVYAENNKLPGGDPDALKMLIAGEIQFFTLMGGIIGTVVPVAESQQLPFAFKSSAEAHKAIDGALGRYIGEEMAAKGMHLFPVAGFENGMRQVAAIPRPVATPADFDGMKIRVPPGQMVIDTFGAFGAKPVTTSANKIYDSLKTGLVDAQENPLAIVDGFKLYELVKFVSLTNHMWSGFNEMAHPATWKALPEDIKGTIERNITKYVRAQRADQAALNTALREDFVKRGLIFNDVDQTPFRARLPEVYATWREKLGSKCWWLVETGGGKLGYMGRCRRSHARQAGASRS